MQHKKKPRSLDIYDHEAEAYFTSLEDFLTTKGVEKRLNSIRLEIQSERGAYLQNWVYPNRLWWLGFQHARTKMQQGERLQGGLTSLMRLPLQTAAMVNVLQSSMPATVKNEIRQRILSADQLEPVLVELQTATHLWQNGYDIEWLMPEKQGERIPEFLADLNGKSIQVECKTKTADAGRMVHRKNFYRFIDQMAGALDKLGLMGSIRIAVAKKMPSSQDWFAAISAEIVKHAKVGQYDLALDDEFGAELQYDLQKRDGKSISQNDLMSKIKTLRTPHAHSAVRSAAEDSIVDPVIVQLESHQPDSFLTAVLKDLRDANKQLLPDHAALIVCFVPEIASFKGLGSGSALEAMTNKFFIDHASENVYAVTYCSTNKQQAEASGNVSMSMPSLIFYNPKYDESFGTGFPVHDPLPNSQDGNSGP